MGAYIGQKLGNYQLTRLLGEGGFAQVYLGEHIYLGTQAAIKVLSTQMANDSGWFLTEARTIARLVHPNIVRVLEFGVEGSTPFLVMDYAPKGTLRQSHPRGTVLPLPIVISYVKQVAEALQYAHDMKLVHRDVKPENMLLGRNNEVLLSDFGIALIAQTLTAQNMQNIAGTLPYTAPEQIQGKSRQASDQYSLAIVAYEWLVGRRPFDGTLSEIVAQQLTIAPPSLRASVPTLPPAVEQVILKALEKDPDQRFSSIQAFALALAQAAQSAIFIDQQNSRYIEAKPVSATMLPPGRPVVSPPPVSVAVTPPARPTPSRTVQAPPPGTLVCSYREHANVVSSLAWLADGRRIISTSNDRAVRIWDAIAGNTLQVYQDASEAVRIARGSSDGTRIATVGVDAVVRVWQVGSNRLLATYRGHLGSTVNALAWAPGQYTLASAATDGTAHVWDATTGQALAIYRGHTDAINALALAPDTSASPPGQSLCIVSGGNDASVHIWEALTASAVARYRNQTTRILSVAWSPSVYPVATNALNSSRVACGREDGLIQMWDTTTKREVLTYRYPAPVRAVAWSPDGRRFAYASEDKTLEVWDTMTNQKLLALSHTAPLRVMAWSPDGRYLAAGGGDMAIQVWVAP